MKSRPGTLRVTEFQEICTDPFESSRKKNQTGMAIDYSDSIEDKSHMELQKPATSMIGNTTRHFDLVDYMRNGYACCRMIIEKDNGVDFIHEDVNKGYERLTGLKDVVGRRITEVLPGLAETNPDFIDKHRRVVETGIPDQFEVFLVALNKWFDITIYRPEPGYSVAMFDDITERKLAESDIKRMSRALLATSRCNEALIQTSDEIELLHKICSIMVETGGYRMAWVGYAEHDEAKSIRQMAHAGFEEGYISMSRISWAEIEIGQGPVGTAIRTGQPTSSHDIVNDPLMDPWQKEAVKRGYASILSLPLKSNNEVFGALTIYSDEPYAFNSEETKLITALAENLTYGITMLRTREAKKESEASLMESEERLRKLFEGHSSIMLLVDPETLNIIDANRAAAEFYGWSVDELRRMNIHQINMDSAEEKHENIDKVRRSKQNRFIFRHRKANGSISDVEVVSNAFVVNTKEVFYSIITDITDKRHAEEALTKSEERFRALFENHSAMMLLIDPESGKIIDANQAASTFYGWSIDEMRTMSIQQITTVTNAEVKINMLKAKTSEQNQFVFRHKKIDGSLRDVEVFSNTITIEGKEILYAIIHDITERKRYESLTAFRLRILQMAEAHSVEELLMAILDKDDDDQSLRPLFDAFPEITFLVDRSGTILVGNEAFKESIGKKESIIGSNYYTYLSPELVRESRRKIDEVLFTGEKVTYDEEREEQILRHTIYPIPNKDGEITKLLMFSVDFTTLNQTEKEEFEKRVHYRNLFNNMENGFAYCRVLFENEIAVDFVYEVVNRNFKKLTGWEYIEGQKISDVIPDILQTNTEFIERVGKIALSGVAEQFEFYFSTLNKWFDIRVYSHQKGYFVMVLSPMITFKTGNWEWNLSNGGMIWDDEIRMLYGQDLHLGIPSYELWRDSIMPSDKEHTDKVIKDAIEKGKTFNVVYNVGDSDGARRRLMTQGFPVKDDSGSLKRYMGISIDISEYKNINTNHLINTTNLNNLLNSSEEAVCAIGPDGIIIEANENFNQEYSKDKTANLKGEDINNIFSRQLFEERKDKFRHLYETGEPVHFKDRGNENQGINSAGNDNVYQISAYPVYGEYEKIDSLAVFITKTNDNNEAEKARRQFDKQYQTLIAASPDSIITTNLDGIISSVSDIGLEIFGASNKADVIGKPFTSIVYQNDIKIINEIFDVTYREGLIQNKEILLKKKNNTLYSAEISAALIQDYNGAPSSYMMIIRDISQRKIIESELFHAKRLISLGEMASGIAHEIYQPINNIGLTVDKILFEASKNKWSCEKEIKDKSEKIFENIIRVQTIIDNIRSFSSTDNNYISSVVNINKGIRNALLMFSEQCKHRSIILDFKPERERISVTGNIYKFEQVISNLIKNSIDALEEKKLLSNNEFDMKIIIRSFYKEDVVAVTIEDNGIGISEKDIEYIMHPFFTTKDSGKGTGLGLSISYGIINEMNGDMKISSKPGAGTNVIITLPNIRKLREVIP